MSEEEVQAVEEVAVEAPAPIEAKLAPMDPDVALQEVLKTALHSDALARGLKEAAKALDRREAHLCVLASSVNEKAYVKLVTVLAKERGIPLMKVADSKVLGEWAGLCQYNADGQAVKVVGCGCVVVKKWGGESEARQVLLNHLKTLA